LVGKLRAEAGMFAPDGRSDVGSLDVSQKKTADDRRVGWRDLVVVAAGAVLTASTVVASDRGLWLYPRVFTSVFLPGLTVGLRVCSCPSRAACWGGGADGR
jgi:hypothetical protein